MSTAPHGPLRAVSVLVDGNNVELQSGTGIKNYTVAHLIALKQLGADVGALFSSRHYDEPVLNEVALFDRAPAYRWGPRRYASYARDLVHALTGAPLRPRRHTTEIVVRHGLGVDFLREVTVYSFEHVFDDARTTFFRTGRMLPLAFDTPIHVWHCMMPQALRVRGARHVTTIPDIIPLRLPYSTPANKAWWYRLTKASIDRADLIVAISEHTKHDIMDFFRVSEDRIRVTYPPTLLAGRPLDDAMADLVLRRYGLARDRYLLYVGNIEPRKNLPRLFDAYAMSGLDLPLVIVGRRAWLWRPEIDHARQLFGARFGDVVRVLERVSDDELPHLYAHARCFVFPSLYEGFGLPPLEAMTLGCPVVASRASSLPEVCGDAAEYCDPYDVHDICAALTTVAGDAQRREAMRKRGLEQAARFSMEHYAAAVAEAYRAVL